MMLGTLVDIDTLRNNRCLYQIPFGYFMVIFVYVFHWSFYMWGVIGRYVPVGKSDKNVLYFS